MFRVRLGLAFVTAACWLAGGRDVIDAWQDGASIRGGVETIVIGVVFGGLLAATFVWRRR